MKKKLVKFSDLTQGEKEVLEKERLARAKRQNRDLLDGVKCVCPVELRNAK